MILIQGYRHRDYPHAHLLIYVGSERVMAHAYWDNTYLSLHFYGNDNPHYIPILPTDTQESLWNQRKNANNTHL